MSKVRYERFDNPLLNIFTLPLPTKCWSNLYVIHQPCSHQKIESCMQHNTNLTTSYEKIYPNFMTGDLLSFFKNLG